mgnify:CR=1 FL=1
MIGRTREVVESQTQASRAVAALRYDWHGALGHRFYLLFVFVDENILISEKSVKFGFVVLSSIFLILEFVLVHLLILVGLFPFSIEESIHLCAFSTNSAFLFDYDWLLVCHFESKRLNLVSGDVELLYESVFFDF